MPWKPLLPVAALAVMPVLAVAGATGDSRVRPEVAPLLHVPRRAAPPGAAPGGFTVEHVRSRSGVPLHARPGGPVVARAAPRTQFGSPQTLSVVARVRGWLGVVNEDVANGGVAWVRAHTPSLRPRRTRVALRVSLRRRRLELIDGDRVERRMSVGVGRPGSPTPRGRFAITDKLSGSRYGSVYGCCILALSGRQPHTPAGWRGGNRLAIHGTDDPGTIGRSSSAGCLHARAGDLKLLMRKVALGTPVFIR